MKDYTKEYNDIVEYIENTETKQKSMPWLLGWLKAAILHKDIDYEMAYNIIEDLIMDTDLIK